MPKCRCGCEGEAAYILNGFDYDPKAPGGKGKAFVELCCSTAADYIEEMSAEFHFPCTRLPLDRDTVYKTSGHPPTTMI